MVDTAVGVWMGECQATVKRFWIKALYECNPFTIYNMEQIDRINLRTTHPFHIIKIAECAARNPFGGRRVDSATPREHTEHTRCHRRQHTRTHRGDAHPGRPTRTHQRYRPAREIHSAQRNAMWCYYELTWPDHHGHGGLLDDGAYAGEGGEAAVVLAAVVQHGVGDVQVPVQPHGHPRVLLDLVQAYRAQERQTLHVLFIYMYILYIS